MEKKICSDCGTENEKEYIYCKNCGAPLASVKKEEAPPSAPTGGFAPEHNNAAPEYTAYTSHTQQSDYTYNPPGGVNYTPYGAYTGYGIDGIPAEDITFFVGKKSAEIMPKFMKMEITRSKTSWCWPAAILGFIFGPMGAALWFLYRKMYKTAIILLAVGAILTFTTAAMTYDTNSADIGSVFDAITSGDLEAFSDAINGIGKTQTALDIAAGAVEDIANLATCIITGIFGFYAYKEHCVKTIRNFRQSIVDQRYYRMGLASLGGVSGGMLAVGIICMIVVTNAASAVTVLLSGILK